MKEIDQEMQQLIAEYLNTEITGENLRKLEVFAAKEGVSLADLVNVYQQLDLVEIEEPGVRMDKQFYQMLKTQKLLIKEKENKWSDFLENLIRVMSFPQIPRLAYGFILLLVGLIIGNMIMPNRGYEKQISSLSIELKEMREIMVLTMIKDNQATERLKAVSYVNQMEFADDKVIDALFKTLNNDENVNVRLVSLEALVKFVHLPIVREGLIKSIQQQESPIVIMELTEVLIQLQDKKSINELQNLLKNEDLDPNLRYQIKSSMKVNI